MPSTEVTMKGKEFNEKAGKILGIKVDQIAFVNIAMKNNNHLDQQIIVGIKPTEAHAKKLKELALEFGGFK